MSFEERSLLDLFDLHDHRRIPVSGVEREKRKGEFRYYGAQGVIDFIDGYLFDGEFILLAEDGENLRTRKQPIAQIVSGQFWVNNHAHILSARKGYSTNSFLNALLNWIDVSPFVTGAAQPKLSQSSLVSIRVNVPDIYGQRRIGTILTQYSDLISVNQRRIALLEDAARRIYREWFVNLRFPGHESVPIKNGIPEGWNLLTISDVASVNSLSIGIRDNLETISYIDISSVSPGFIENVTEYRLSEAPGRAKRRVRHGDVIWSCVRPNRRSFALIWEPSRNLIASTGFAVMSAEKVPFSFLYFATTTEEFVGYLEQNATGAAYPAVTAKSFEDAELMIPDSQTLNQFDDLVLPILSQIQTLRVQNAALTQARDLLLPKLMSGEIDVSGIPLPEEVVE